MVTITSLWLPIVVSAVAVFLTSSLVHMVLPWHKGDYPGVPDQDRVQEALRPFAIPPGDYMLPDCSDRKEMATPEFQEKLAKGPVMMLTVMPNGPFLMGATFVQWFIFLLTVGVASAYMASRAVAPGAEYLEVFRFAGTTAFLCYGMGSWPLTIWYKRGAGLALKNSFDGLLYGAVTGGVFGWLWPV
jgi:hypothetical protein